MAEVRILSEKLENSSNFSEKKIVHVFKHLWLVPKFIAIVEHLKV